MHKLFNYNQILSTQGKHNRKRLYLKLVIATAFISFILLTSCTMDPNSMMNIYFAGEGGAEVTLEWDSNIEPDLAGYKIYCGTASGIYEKSIDVGDTTFCTIKGLNFNTTYYFTATAYNIYRCESNYADEITFLTPDEDGVSL